MAFDALAVKALVRELQILTGARIEKVHQPERDEIILHIRSRSDTHKLVISASAAHPRVHFTGETKKNPMTAPMFCMLLRKHIQSGKITGISQEGFERIIYIDVESRDDMGEPARKRLIAEIMGRHSNIILVNDENRVIDSIKHIDMTVSSVRQIMPGFTYTLPPAQNKTVPSDPGLLDIDLSENIPSGTRADKAVLDKIGGISPLTAREIVYSALGTTAKCIGELNEGEKAQILIYTKKICAEPDFSPCMITDAASGKIIDFSSVDIKQYGGGAKITRPQSMNSLLCEFYSSRDCADRMKQKSADLVKLLTNNTERIRKKLALYQNTLKNSESKEENRIKGDLITANIYKIKQGDKEVIVQNYYTGGEMPITLSPELSPSQNAQKYYKLYNKAKNAEKEMTPLISAAEADIEYLESTLSAVMNAESEDDINDIRAELAEQGYIRKQAASKKQKSKPKPLHFRSSDGFDIYTGKNNTQNDYLTLKFANTSDIWFHTKNIHGSHTIIKLGTDKDVPKSTITEAARIAAYYSKARNSSRVPVDYTVIKNVKKPSGAKPGMVIYDKYNTVYVTPENPQSSFVGDDVTTGAAKSGKDQNPRV
ncbi:MAG: NFACT family protein [Oscillospiraceae bacterium]|nr:NFACT family protein [Oscillospiraceae bacterium]